MSELSKKGFNQVVRTTTKDEGNLLDPLSMFALQDSKPAEDALSVTKPITAGGYTTEGLFESDFSSTKEASKHNNSNKVKNISSNVDNDLLDAPKTNFSAISKITPTISNADDKIIDEGILRYLSGEYRVMNILDSFLVIATGEVLSGVLFMTNYRLVFIPSMTDLTSIALHYPSVYSWLQVPLASIDRIDREKRGKDVYNSSINIVISCKDFRQLRITIRSNDIERTIGLISAYAFPNNMRHLFAFTHKITPPLVGTTTNTTYDAPLEFSRIGILDNSLWRVTAVNAEYKLCNTYPSWLVVPAAISDEELYIIASFRSGHRLPVLCWAHRQNGATMWRSSQPKSGVSGSCMQDEKMLDIIARSARRYIDSINSGKRYSITSSSSNVEPVLNIVDCRSRASAMANRAAGAGYESQTNYPTSRLDFHNISNIHAVRDAYRALVNIILNPTATSNNDVSFSKQVEDTQWLNHIRAILKASHETAVYLRDGMPVLVHCSHGWDRTAQVCSLAQVFLDPFYRTIAGFQVLIEKEWISLGHPFQMRCGHTQDKQARQEDQVSPILLQFLDCVWQIHKQYMQYFEFNARYLLLIADHIYSGRFGNFLFSSDYDRVSM